MRPFGYVKRVIERALDNYATKYIETSSPQPIYHVCFGGMIFSYLVNLPHELRHLEHQRLAKEHAATANGGTATPTH